MTSTDDALHRTFGITVNFDQNEVLLAVGGDVDLTSTPDMKAVVDAVIGRGHRTVVLDVAQMGFIDAAGLSLFVRTAGRLKSLGGQLAVRSPSSLVRQMLHVAALSGQVQLDDDLGPEPIGLGPEPIDLGPEPIDLGPADPTETTPTTRAYARWGIGARTADKHVVDSAMGLVVAVAGLTVPGANGVSISLFRNGRLTTVAATDQLIWDVDAAQCSAGDGPCVDASSKGQVSRILSMEQEERWPSFSPSARHLGLRAVVSNPLVVGGQPVGAITFYSLTAGAFGAQEVGLASALAAQASAILASAGAGDASNPMGDWRAQALRSRDALFQAVGVVMERDGVSEEDAFTSLRRASERSGSPMRARAAEVLASTQVLSQCVVGRTAERHDA